MVMTGRALLDQPSRLFALGDLEANERPVRTSQHLRDHLPRQLQAFQSNKSLRPWVKYGQVIDAVYLSDQICYHYPFDSVCITVYHQLLFDTNAPPDATLVLASVPHEDAPVPGGARIPAPDVRRCCNAACIAMPC